MKDVTLTYAGFAQSIGLHDHLTLAVSLVWHREYVKADAVTRTARREEFILNFMIGAKCPETKAKRIMAQSRTERSEDAQKLYDRARAKFTYHIVRKAKAATPEKSESSGKTDPVALLVTAYGKLTKAQQRKFMASI